MMKEIEINDREGKVTEKMQINDIKNERKNRKKYGKLNRWPIFERGGRGKILICDVKRIYWEKMPIYPRIIMITNRN